VPALALPARRQRGASALLAAFLLLTLMAAASFATGRNLLRELASLAECQRGSEAGAAAEAGLAWALARARVAGMQPGLRVPEAVLGPGPLRLRCTLRIRCLGQLAPEAGRLWQVTACGHCGPAGGGGWNQVREMLLAERRTAEGSPAVRVLAWWRGDPLPGPANISDRSGEISW